MTREMFTMPTTKCTKRRALLLCWLAPFVLMPRASSAQAEAAPANAQPSASRADGKIVVQLKTTHRDRRLGTGTLVVDIYPGAACSTDFVLDHAHAHQLPRGDFFKQHFSATLDRGNLIIAIDPPSGGHPPWWKTITLNVHDWALPRHPLPPEQHYDAISHILTAVAPATDSRASQGIEVSRYVLIRP
jgi:hypothetical protein